MSSLCHSLKLRRHAVGQNIKDYFSTLLLASQNKLKEKWKQEGAPAPLSPPNTFEINKEYVFKPAVKSHAYYNEARTVDNEIGERSFTQGKCIRYLQKTKMGPLFLFSGKLDDELDVKLKGITIYFGVIYNKTDPERSHAV